MFWILSFCWFSIYQAIVPNNCLKLTKCLRTWSVAKFLPTIILFLETIVLPLQNGNLGQNGTRYSFSFLRWNFCKTFTNCLGSAWSKSGPFPKNVILACSTSRTMNIEKLLVCCLEFSNKTKFWFRWLTTVTTTQVAVILESNLCLWGA